MTDQKMKEFMLATSVFNALPEDLKKKICGKLNDNLLAIVGQIDSIWKLIETRIK